MPADSIARCPELNSVWAAPADHEAGGPQGDVVGSPAVFRGECDPLPAMPGGHGPGSCRIAYGTVALDPADRDDGCARLGYVGDCGSAGRQFGQFIPRDAISGYEDSNVSRRYRPQGDKPAGRERKD